MIDLALDPLTGDLIFEDYDLDLVDDTNQISQNLAIRLRFVLKEWFLDITQGVPYFEEFFIKNPNLIHIESVLKEEIVETRGVVEITRFDSVFDKKRRILRVDFGATSITGEELSKELELPV